MVGTYTMKHHFESMSLANMQLETLEKKGAQSWWPLATAIFIALKLKIYENKNVMKNSR